MDSLVVVLIVLVVAFLLKSRWSGYKDSESWPATWNFDWSGGHGYRRDYIMNERKSSYDHPHSTPGGDGRPRS